MKAGPSRRHNFTQLLRRESGHKGRCKVERHPSKARGGPRPEVERARLAAREIKGLHLLEEIRGNQQKAAQERKDRVWQCGSVRESSGYRQLPQTSCPTEWRPQTQAVVSRPSLARELLRGKQLVSVGFLGAPAYKEMVAWPCVSRAQERSVPPGKCTN